MSVSNITSFFILLIYCCEKISWSKQFIERRIDLAYGPSWLGAKAVGSVYGGASSSGENSYLKLEAGSRERANSKVAWF